MNQLRSAAFLFTCLVGACFPAASCEHGEPAGRQESIQAARSEPQAAERKAPERRPPSFVPIAIEDASGIAFERFYEALHEAEAGRGQARVLIYGASHTAADIYPDVLRQRLQERFGDAGTGFVMPAKPQKYYSIPGIAFETSLGWTGIHVKTTSSDEDHYGLAGLYLTPNSRRARSVFVTRQHGGLSGNATDLELFYWKQPRGGRFKISIDGKATEISTAGKASAAYRHWSVPDETHRVELIARSSDNPIRIFGMSLERNNPGVVIDTLGIPGARASTQLLWNEALQREHMQRRKPNLVVLAYGTNETGDDDQPIEIYGASLRRVVTRIRLAAPDASCLLIGPSDRPIRTETGEYVDRPRTALVVATQREVAAQFGCGFFDVVSFMGGPLSMVDWCESEPPFGTADHVHFTRGGYQAMGNVLHDALMEGYDRPPALIGGLRPLARDASGAAAAGGGEADAAAERRLPHAPVDAGTPAVEELPLSADQPDTPRKPSSKPGSTYRR